MDLTSQLKGSFVALVTPMFEDGSIDFESLAQLIEFQLQNETKAIVAVGTTGESATLSVTEHLAVIQRIVSLVDGRVPVIAGTGANSTAEAIDLSKEAKHLGVSACLSVVPYYNKPTQQGLIGHFKKISETVDIPQILYNVPGRTITDLSNDSVLELVRHPNIIGIKDATGDMERGKSLINQVPEGFIVLSGDDFTAWQLILNGAHGNISVTANVAPQLMSKLCQLSISGQQDPRNAEAATLLQQRLLPLHQALFTQSNPIPVKWALAYMGLMEKGIRLPLTPLSPQYVPALQQSIETLRLTDCLENCREPQATDL